MDVIVLIGMMYATRYFKSLRVIPSDIGKVGYLTYKIIIFFDTTNFDEINFMKYIPGEI